MEINLYSTRDGQKTLDIFANMHKRIYSFKGDPDLLPAPPVDYVNTPEARILFHAFSISEQDKWKK